MSDMRNVIKSGNGMGKELGKIVKPAINAAKVLNPGRKRNGN
jgi:hypothetical protein